MGRPKGWTTAVTGRPTQRIPGHPGLSLNSLGFCRDSTKPEAIHLDLNCCNITHEDS